MDVNKENRIEICFNIINSLCNEFDYLASPDIEERMICSLDCCIGYSDMRKCLIETFQSCEEMRSIIGIEGLKLIQQLEEMKYDFSYYDDEKGFSKKQRWLDFIVFVNTINTFLRDAIKRYQTTTKT